MAQSAHTPLSHDRHSTSAQDGWSTRRIAVTALLCALSFVLTFVEVPIFPPAPWLKYDPSGIVGLVAALAFGPATGTAAVVLPWLLKTLFVFDPWGHLMAVVANLALVLPTAALARRMQGARGLAAGMAVGAVVSLAACVVGNLVVTPVYAGISTAEVLAMVVPVLLPFNVIKVALNCAGAALVRKPLAGVLGE